MAAVIRLIPNGFEPDHYTEAEVRAGVTVGEAMAATRPDWLLLKTFATIDGVPCGPDCFVPEGATLTVALIPEMDPGTWLVIWNAVWPYIVSAVVSYAINYFLFPKPRSGKAASPAYSVNIDQNAARIGQSVPVIYGRVRATPDLAMQPYSEYVAHNQVVRMLLTLGMGEYTIHNVFVGGSRVSDFPAGTIKTWIYPPSLHKQTLGNIEKGSNVNEDTATVLESVGLELNAPNDAAELVSQGHVTGPDFDPHSDDPAYFDLLNVGTRYEIKNNLGGKAERVYLGTDASNRAMFNGPLPTVPAPLVVPVNAALGQLDVADIGRVWTITDGDAGYENLPRVAMGEFITLVDPTSGTTWGPMQNVGTYPNPLQLPLLSTSGPGYLAAMPNAEFGRTGLNLVRNSIATYSIREITTTGAADAFRWRGWFAVCKPNLTVNAIDIDVAMPSGIAWITDKGDYKRAGVHLRIEYQVIDANDNPIGVATTLDRSFEDQTNQARRFTIRIANLAVARYRVRIARRNNRDQRTSKELSQTTLDGIKGKIYHAPGTAAYADCTIIAMEFTATAGLSAASNRRITVDCTRNLRRLGNPASFPAPTTNPADAVVDAYIASYGAAAPLADIDTATLERFYTQWSTVNGFNAIFDQPTTVIQAMQAILVPVRAMPVPMGASMSFVQDGPRAREYMFGPGSIIANSLGITYDFDSETDHDFLELVYQEPRAWTEAIVAYPTQGVRPMPLELFGCTDATHATSFAKLTWQERLYARKQCRLTLEGEGFALQPLSRFGLVVPGVRMGNGGRVIEYNPATKTFELDGYFPAVSAGITPRLAISFYDDGKVSPTMAVVPLAQPSRFVTLVNPLPYGWAASDSIIGDGTQWFATKTADQVMDFRVSDLTMRENFQVQVTGVAYDPRVYTGTFLEAWQT